MKKLIIYITLILIINVCAEEPEWKVYATIPQVKNVLSKYKDNDPIQKINEIKNPNSRFLALVSEFLIIQNAYFECKDFDFINIGYLGKDGKGVDSGANPESVKDLSLRAKYIERIGQNKDNRKTSQKIGNIRDALHKSLRKTVDLMSEDDKIIATSIVEQLQVLKK